MLNFSFRQFCWSLREIMWKQREREKKTNLYRNISYPDKKLPQDENVLNPIKGENKQQIMLKPWNITWHLHGLYNLKLRFAVFQNVDCTWGTKDTGFWTSAKISKDGPWKLTFLTSFLCDDLSHWSLTITIVEFHTHESNKQKWHIFQLKTNKQNLWWCQGLSLFRLFSLVETKDPFLWPESHLINIGVGYGSKIKHIIK